MPIKSPGYYNPTLSRYISTPPPSKPKPAPIVGYTGAGWNYGGQTIPAVTTPYRMPTPTPIAPASAPARALATAAAAPPSQADVLASNPFVGDITGDPMYGLAAQQRQTSLDALRTALREANQNAIIAGGFQIDPSKLSGRAAEFGGDIDAATLAAAAQNQFSTRAGIEQGLQQGLTSLPYDLARRSAARSGAAITHAEALNKAAEVQRNQAMNSLLSSITGNVTNYFGQQAGVESNFAQAQRDIANRLAQLAYGRQGITSETGGLPSQEDLNEEGYPYEGGGGPLREDAFNQLSDFVQNLPARLPSPSAFKSSAGLVYKPGTYSATQKVLRKVRGK